MNEQEITDALLELGIVNQTISDNYGKPYFLERYGPVFKPGMNFVQIANSEDVAITCMTEAEYIHTARRKHKHGPNAYWACACVKGFTSECWSRDISNAIIEAFILARKQSLPEKITDQGDPET